ncbi:MAG: dipeptidase [Chloroflexi bacterium]|nr:dipeptidase [Chloroflexota bacterium]
MSPSPTADDRAAALHRAAIVINGLCQGGETLEQIVTSALAGGVTATNLTVAVSEGFAEAARAIEAVFSGVEQLQAQYPVRVATSVEEILAAKQAGGTALVIGFQDATPLEGRLEHLRLFSRLGLRILQLTYQRRNLLGDGCGEPADAGLSLFGQAVIAEANRLGVLIDLSHVGYRSTMEAIEASRAPVTFSHVNLYRRNPIPRNKRDDQIVALARKGGVVGINAISRLLSPHGRTHGATLAEYLDQIDEVVRLVGIEHVGIGLDIYEGLTPAGFERRKQTFLATFPELQVGGDFPLETYWVTGLSSAAQLPSLTASLLDRGYGEAEVRAVLGENFLRLFRAAWQPT